MKSGQQIQGVQGESYLTCSICEPTSEVLDPCLGLPIQDILIHRVCTTADTETGHWSTFCTSRICVWSVLENNSTIHGNHTKQMEPDHFLSERIREVGEFKLKMENSGNMIQLSLLHWHSLRKSTVLTKNCYPVVDYFQK